MSASTFLFAHLVDSTREPAGADSSGEADLPSALHEAAARRRGTWLPSEPSSALIVFPRADEAARAALDALRSLQAECDRARLRIGLHTGEARAQGRTGPACDQARHVAEAAHGGQILLSAAARAMLQGAPPDGASIKDLGEHRLKDLSPPQRLYMLARPDIDRDFPPPVSLDTLPNNLPAQLTSFVGRAPEMSALRDLLHRHRLITLVGVGGVGKTRLALQAAADAADRFADGVWWVDLGPLGEPELLAATVADVLPIPERHGLDSTGTLVEFLRAMNLLVVLDNCEHLTGACAELAARLLGACSKVAILATSREPLKVTGEQTWPIHPLALPDPGEPLDAMAEQESVRLFAERAVAALPTFRLRATNAAPVARICRRLDGIPLALELAAALVRVLAPEQIEERLAADRFGLLRSHSKDQGARHRTLREAVDWSYEMLSPPERLVLECLSVFPGGFDLEAAEKVAAAGDTKEADVLELLSGLVDRSLVVVEEHQERARYRLLDTIREYARERIEEHGDAHEARTRLAEWCEALVERAGAHLWGEEQARWLARLDHEQDTIRAVLAWGLSPEGDPERTFRMSHTLHSYWEARGRYREGLRWLETTLAAAEGTGESRLKALTVAGILARSLGDLDRAQAWIEEGLRLTDAQTDDRMRMILLNDLGNVAELRGDIERARDLHQEALATAQRIGDEHYVAGFSLNLGEIEHDCGNLDGARDLVAGAAASFRRLGDVRHLAMALGNLGGIANDQRDIEGARTTLTESLALAREVGARFLEAVAVNNLGFTEELAGNAGVAFAHYREALPLLVEMDLAAEVSSCLENLARLAARVGSHRAAALLLGASGRGWGQLGQYREAMREALGDTELERLLARGGPMSAADVVVLALDEQRPSEASEGALPLPAPGARNSFRRKGEYWALTFGGKSALLKDCKGMRHLAMLLASPGREFHAAELASPRAARQMAGRMDAGEVLDARAREEYRRRLAELECEMEEATQWNDPSRAARAGEERDAVARELGRALGIGGRPRRAADPGERARKAVSNRIREAIARIREANEPLGLHLADAVRTGTFCSYAPAAPLDWDL